MKISIKVQIITCNNGAMLHVSYGGCFGGHNFEFHASSECIIVTLMFFVCVFIFVFNIHSKY